MSEERKSNLRFIIPVEKIPGRKRDGSIIYDEILKEFLSSKVRYAEVNLTEKKPVTICYALKRRLKEKAVSNVKVRYICKKVYLEREV
jgi:hypothetical protein